MIAWQNCACVSLGYKNCAQGNIKKFTRKCVQWVIWKFKILIKSLDAGRRISNSGNCRTREKQELCIWNTRPWGPTPIHSWWKNQVCCWPNQKVFSDTRTGVWKTRTWKVLGLGQMVLWSLYKWRTSRMERMEHWLNYLEGLETKKMGTNGSDSQT